MRTLSFRQKLIKITDHYPIKDEDGKTCYIIDQDFKLIGDQFRVYDAKKNLVMTIKRKLVTLLPQYEILFHDGRKISVSAQLSLMKRKMKVTSDDFHLQVKGNPLDYVFDVYQDRKRVGKIQKKILAIGDAYVLTIDDRAFEGVVVGIAIAIDNLRDREANNALQNE